MQRRRFLKFSLFAATGLVGAVWARRYFVSLQRKIQFVHHDHSVQGHFIRQRQPDFIISHEEKIQTVILGAGISGLSAGYFLKKSGYDSFRIFEMSDRPGGNSDCFDSKNGQAPWAAHYLPVIRNDDSTLTEFLVENNVITGFKDKLPNYNEEYLCQAPHERLLYKGSWQEGSLMPQQHLNATSSQKINDFLKLTNDLKNKKGTDGKFLFSIPVEKSSQDSDWLKLDQLTFFDYIVSHGFQCEELDWYIQYALADDFGCSWKTVSAWAGLHYFCSRNGLSANTEEQSVLTWPQGNAFLSECLQKSISAHIQTSHQVVKISAKGIGYEVVLRNTRSQNYIRIIAEKVIYALPRYTAPYVISDYPKLNSGQYFPWLISQIRVDRSILEEKSTLCWDNVKFGEKGLGYINNQHQLLSQDQQKVLLTYYYSFFEGQASENRKLVAEWSEQDTQSFIINELKKMHPKIEEHIESIDYKFLGHGMIAPVVNFIWKDRLQDFVEIWKGIHFCHTDMSGISIFEEAFHQGHKAALRALSELKR
jgi:hypothetical protein